MKDWYKEVSESDLPEPYQKFVGVIDVPTILTLCEVFGGGSVYFPKVDDVYNRIIRNRDIRKRYLNGAKVARLVAEYNISESSIMRIVQGYASGQISMLDQCEGTDLPTI